MSYFYNKQLIADGPRLDQVEKKKRFNILNGVTDENGNSTTVTAVNELDRQLLVINPIMGVVSDSNFSVSSSSQYASAYSALMAFDGSYSTYAASSYADRQGFTLSIDFDNKYAVGCYSIVCPSDSSELLSESIKDWVVEGSIDSINWEVVDTQNDQTFEALTIRYFNISLDKIKEYSRMRIVVLENASASRASAISDLRFYRTMPTRLDIRATTAVNLEGNLFNLYPSTINTSEFFKYGQPTFSSNTEKGFNITGSTPNVDTNYLYNAMNNDDSYYASTETEGFFDVRFPTETLLTGFIKLTNLESNASDYTREFQIFTDSTMTVPVTNRLTMPNSSSGEYEARVNGDITSKGIYIKFYSSYGSLVGFKYIFVNANLLGKSGNLELRYSNDTNKYSLSSSETLVSPKQVKWYQQLLFSDGIWEESPFAVRANNTFYTGAMPIHKAFDGTAVNELDCYHSDSSIPSPTRTNPVDIDIYIEEGITLTGLSFQNRNHTDSAKCSIKDMLVMCSDDGISWQTFYSHTNTDYERSSVWGFNLNSVDPKQYYRIRILTNSDESNPYVAISNIYIEGYKQARLIDNSTYPLTCLEDNKAFPALATINLTNGFVNYIENTGYNDDVRLMSVADINTLNALTSPDIEAASILPHPRSPRMIVISEDGFIYANMDQYGTAGSYFKINGVSLWEKVVGVGGNLINSFNGMFHVKVGDIVKYYVSWQDTSYTNDTVMFFPHRGV